MSDKYFDDSDSQAPGPGQFDPATEPPNESPPPATAWRILSPSTFALALVMFPLPWIQVQCSVRHPKTGELVDMVFIEQSGMQTAYGGYSMPGLFGLEKQGKAPRMQGLKPEDCPLMIAYPLLLVLGLILGSTLRAGGTRTGLVSLCGLGALLVLGKQLEDGFPLESVMEKELADIKAGKAPPVDAQPARNDGEVVVKRTIWLWLGLAFTIAAAGSGLLEMLFSPRPRLEMLHEPNPPPYG